ncbi:lysophospholipid acyltransferase family protein [Lichenicoccus sp.]|uniref:lysophospholipid acyltransferase family protein n=1 Tax=Lichenicoccus sp. TaxID=2781899 RepID=UPI003D0BDE88
MAARQSSGATIAHRVCFVVVLALWGAGCLGWSLAAPVLRLLLPASRREAVGQWGIQAGFRNMLGLMQRLGLARLDLASLDLLPPDQPMVIACNHPGLLDAVVVTSRLRGVVCITKASLWDNPFLGGGIRLAGYIRNDSPIALVRAGVASLAAGKRLLVFPEGTRTPRDAAVGDFRAGFALMASTAGVPVQAILIETDTPYLRKGWPLQRMPAFPIVIRVRVGRQFRVDRDVRLFVDTLHRYFEQELGDGAGAGQARRPLARHTA